VTFDVAAPLRDLRFQCGVLHQDSPSARGDWASRHTWFSASTTTVH
jgi:hypothetical protein